MNLHNLFDKAIERWRQNKGVGSAIIPNTINDKYLISGILNRIYQNSNSCKTLICTFSFDERISIMEFLTHQEDEDINNKFKDLFKSKHISIVTQDFIIKHPVSIPTLFIAYHITSPFKHLRCFYESSKFKLTILNKFLKNKEDNIELYKLCPLLDEFKANELELVRLSTPVEETRIGATMEPNSEDAKLLEYYNNDISTSIASFGGFDKIDEARIGNIKLNISAIQICNQLAKENGWNEHLDMSSSFNMQLDNLYNPSNIKERASKTYEIIHNRAILLSDYKLKLGSIYNIVKENKNKNILIINKRSDFANNVTDYINKQEGKIICGNYHDKIEPAYAVDINGQLLTYKNGEHKGEPKILKAQAQRTNNELLFNKGVINVLSTGNAPDKKLRGNVDIVIITSPQCGDIKNYLYRLSNIRYLNNKIVLYTIYCKSTTEEKLLDNKDIDKNHVIVEKDNFSENNFDFSVAD